MNTLLTLAFLFAVGSFLGWCLEVVFRHFVTHKWINPGFLIGPYLPLYGFSLCMLYALARLEPYIPIQNYILKKLVLFVIMAICITAIEYIAGLIFIKGMNIKLWDYSDRWGNVQGIICPLFSFFWLLLSATYYFFIHPYILNSLDWLAQNLAFSFIIGFFFGIFEHSGKQRTKRRKATVFVCISLRNPVERTSGTVFRYTKCKAAVERLAGTDAEERKITIICREFLYRSTRQKKNGKQNETCFPFFL